MQKLYQFIFKFWRAKRMRLFEDTIKPSSADVMLDVGGYPWFWTSYPQKTKRIDCINLHGVHWDSDAFPDHHIVMNIGDGCDLNHGDGSYDIVFSNSVIEHVGNWEKQKAFAHEVRRVGKKIWIQTPAYECPIEPHYLALFVHWLPVSFRRKSLRWVSVWGWVGRPDQEKVDETIAFTQLLKKKQVQQLFPDCHILTERLLGVFPKSYIAVRT